MYVNPQMVVHVNWQCTSVLKLLIQVLVVERQYSDTRSNDNTQIHKLTSETASRVAPSSSASEAARLSHTAGSRTFAWPLPVQDRLIS